MTTSRPNRPAALDYAARGVRVNANLSFIAGSPGAQAIPGG